MEHWLLVYLVVGIGDGAGNVGPVHGAVEGDVFPEIAFQLLEKEGGVGVRKNRKRGRGERNIKEGGLQALPGALTPETSGSRL